MGKNENNLEKKIKKVKDDFLGYEKSVCL